MSEIVYCCGMRRSGGTLIYQLTKELVERSGRGRGVGFYPTLHQLSTLKDTGGLHIVKCHAYISRPGKIIYSYRDIRDVTVSLCKMWDLSFSQVIFDELPVMLESYYAWMAQFDKVVFRYETAINDLPGMVMTIADYLDIPVTPDECIEIANRYSLDQQQQRIANFDYESLPEQWMPHPESLLHRNHIQSGATNRWQAVMKPDEINMFHQLYGGWLRGNGYEC